MRPTWRQARWGRWLGFWVARFVRFRPGDVEVGYVFGGSGDVNGWFTLKSQKRGWIENAARLVKKTDTSMKHYRFKRAVDWRSLRGGSLVRENKVYITPATRQQIHPFLKRSHWFGEVGDAEVRKFLSFFFKVGLLVLCSKMKMGK